MGPTSTGKLIAPKKSPEIPENAQWLAGIGAGSWFTIEATSIEKQFFIQRFAPDGSPECRRTFEETSENNFDIQKDYQFTYLSHCKHVTIIQGNIKHTFKYFGALSI